MPLQPLKRREFIRVLGGAAAMPVLLSPVARAQQLQQPVRRVGVLSQFVEEEARANTAVFKQRLQELGWTEGRNIQFDLRAGAGGAGNDQRRDLRRSCSRSR